MTKAVPGWNNSVMKSCKTIGAASAKRGAVTVLAGILGLAGLVSAACACELKITWKAALASVPAMSSPGTGTAAIDFDLAHPGATVQVETKGLQDVRAVEMHIARSYTDHTGPAVLTLYTADGGPPPATLTRHVTEADLHKQVAPKVTSFSDVVSAVLNGQAYVVVTTKAHPEGELSGVIRMHKEEIYSDSALDSAHDAALHHAAQAAAPATTPSPTPSLPR